MTHLVSAVPTITNSLEQQLFENTELFIYLFNIDARIIFSRETQDEGVNFKQHHHSALSIKPVTIIVNLLKVLTVGLSEKEKYRKTLILHSGLHLLRTFLLPHLYRFDTKTVKYFGVINVADCVKIFDAASTCIELILRNANNLSLADKITILPKHPSDNIAGQASNSGRKEEIHDQARPVKMLNRIVRGIRKSPKIQPEDPSNLQIDLSEATSNYVTLNVETIDERKVFHFDCNIFFSTVLQFLRKMANDTECTSSSSSNEECKLMDEIAPSDKCGATSSKSSGYLSKSRKSSSAASNLEDEIQNSSIQHKSTYFSEYNPFQLQQLGRICRLVLAVIQENDVALREVYNINGPKVFLQLLISTAASLDSGKKTGDCTQDVNESVSNQQSANISYKSLNEHSNNLAEETKLLQYLDLAEVKSTSSHDSEELAVVGTPKINQDEKKVKMDHSDEVETDIEYILGLKLRILSSALSICLLFSKKNCDVSNVIR